MTVIDKAWPECENQRCETCYFLDTCADELDILDRFFVIAWQLGLSRTISIDIYGSNMEPFMERMYYKHQQVNLTKGENDA